MEVFLGTVQSFAFPFAPSGWSLCNGQILNLQQYNALYALLGVTYGGNGSQTFGLPNLQGRTLIGQGNGTNLTPRPIGTFNGSETVNITLANLPAHNHAVDSSGLQVSTTVKLASVPTASLTVPSATNGFIGASGNGPGAASIFSTDQGANPITLQGVSNAVSGSITTAQTGGGTPAASMNPFLAINFSIALSGLFPSRD
ncbi:MAG: Phage tail collar [Pseudomonas sp.]|jgi:microcystin-dependent protein|uniref:phage tail protein n=1 Tax=Pseudomonas sp. TaxID=306 RepID=UPI00263695C6|nr:tail fiber protein [Pseudomonas sp.]MDB6047956.1 Phage tail collar [Pseudomonas sp.]